MEPTRCPKCGGVKITNLIYACLCEQCHKAAIEEIKQKENMPVGGTSCDPAYELRPLFGSREADGVDVPISLRHDARQRRFKHE